VGLRAIREFIVMPKKSKIAFRNRNHTGWWIFCEVEQWVSHRQKKLSKNSRCFVWENTRLIRATNRDQAYKKALKLGAEGHPSQTNRGEWRFAGISMLLPVYEKIEDGSEILWDKRGLMTVKQIKKLVKSKQKLLVFNDNENA
jgi:hypothetical protein